MQRPRSTGFMAPSAVVCRAMPMPILWRPASFDGISGMDWESSNIRAAHLRDHENVFQECGMISTKFSWGTLNPLSNS